MIEYIELYENPFQITEGTEKQLHNIISQEVMPAEVREVLSEKSSVVQRIEKRMIFRPNQEIIRHNSQEQYQNMLRFDFVCLI